MTFHYLLMAGHAIYLKQLMAELYHTGLTPGQPKVLDYLMEHDGANQKEIAKCLPYRSRYPHLRTQRHGGKIPY